MAVSEHRPEFVRKLKSEIELWIKEGIISDEQKKRLLERYSAQEEAEKKAGPGRLITTISILGSILVGTGVLLFIASNWAGMARWLRLCFIFLPMLISYGTGYYLRYERKSFPKVGAALILLGSVIFGAGIFLIAQIYHITVHYPNGPLLWGIGVLPLAYLLRLRTILTLAIIDLLIWLGMEARFHVDFHLFSFMPFFTLYLLAGIALWSTGLMHRVFSTFAWLSGPYLTIGILLAYSGAYILTFDVFRGAMGAEGFIWFYAGLISIFLATILPYLLLSNRDTRYQYEAAGLFLMLCLVMSAILFLRQEPGMPYVTRSTSVIVLTSNIFFAAAVFGLIILGYLRQSAVYINLGLLFFVLDLTARYFDMFWRLLPRSVFFIIGGAILLLGGVYLEKKRRRVLASFDLEEQS